MDVSKGLAWAIGMLGLDFVELLALLEIMFFDYDRNHWASVSSFFRLYFYLSASSFAVQLLGVALVPLGWFRLGGILQIVSSSFHVPKGEGIIGVIGGLQAYRYPSKMAEGRMAEPGGSS